MRRRRHTLDLLPLLDVFMVVLFVFATIQEQQLDVTAQTTARMQAELARSSAAAEEAQRQREAQVAAAATLRAEAGAAAAAAEVELAAARDAQTQMQATVERLRAAAERAAATAKLPGAEALRRQEILARLLDHFSVFEIEIEGELAGDSVTNHCCYRTEPLAGAWRSCGVAPKATAELKDWLAEGAGGLVGALRQTRGGNALTIVRHNEVATAQIGRKLEDLLRERLPEHKIYGEGVALHAVACPR